MAAVFPVAQGIESHSGTLTPELWAGKTLVKFYESSVYADIANTDYQGEIQGMGDTVHINIIPDTTINDYVIGQGLTRQRPSPSIVDLLIDKGKYWSVNTNKVQLKQAFMNFIEDWTEDAGMKMGEAIDADILENVYADASSYNAGATAGYKTSSFDLGSSGAPLGLDKTTILDFMIDCGTVLTEIKIPKQNRWFVLPPMFTGMLVKGDLKDASMMGDATSAARNGRLGRIFNFTVYESNQLATTTDGTETVHNTMFGHKCAITFASQLVEERSIPDPDDFGDIMEGLQVYGYKVIKAEGLGHGYIYKL
jgi:hypothetical protein